MTKKAIDSVRCEVVEWVSGQRSKRLTAETESHASRAGNVEQLIAHWCEEKHAELPAHGETFRPDLDNVERAIDRR